MARRRDEQQLLAQHPLAREAVLQRLRLDAGEGDVELVAPQRGEYLGRAALTDADRDAGVGGVEARQQAGQVDRPGRQHRPERDRALEQAAQRGEVGADGIGARHDLPCPLEHHGAGLGQLDATAGAPEQLEAELGLQPPDRLGDRRLREVQLLGGARERPEMGDLDEGAELAKLHRAIVVRGPGPLTWVMAAISHRHCPVEGGLVASGGVTAVALNRWAGVFATKAPPESFFAVSAVFHYLGPAFAVLLFARVEVLGVAWLRIASAALIFAIWRRPWRAFAALDRDGRRVLVAWGAVLAVMNCVFYSAIDRLPLGTVAAIEFLPVIVLAAIGMRTARNLAALMLAVAGVYLLTDVVLEGEPLGVALAAVNAVLFALYIVLGAKVAERGAGAGIDALAAAMLIAAVVVTPIGGWAVVPALNDPVAIVAGIGVGVSSSVIPYVADQLALARISRSTYALMVSLLPATATVIGIVVLAQLPSAVEIVGVALVVAGVAVHRERG